MIITKKHLLTGLALFGLVFNAHSTQAVDKSSVAAFIGVCAVVGCSWWANNYYEQQERLAKINKIHTRIDNLVNSPHALYDQKAVLLEQARELGLSEAVVEERINKIVIAHSEFQDVTKDVQAPLENVLPQEKPVALRSSLVNSSSAVQRPIKKVRFADQAKTAKDQVGLAGLPRAMDFSLWSSLSAWFKK